MNHSAPGRSARSAVHGWEGEALGLELGEELVEGGDGLGAVSATVVHQDDVVGVSVREDVVHDRVRAWAGPVAWVDVPQHLDHAGSLDVGADAWVRGAVRRPEA